MNEKPRDPNPPPNKETQYFDGGRNQMQWAKDLGILRDEAAEEAENIAEVEALLTSKRPPVELDSEGLGGTEELS